MGRNLGFLSLLSMIAERRRAPRESRGSNHRRLRYESLEGRQMLSAVPGDFNVDGIVDAADYSFWRDQLGSVYTADDYGAWRTNFGTASIALEGASIDVGRSGAASGFFEFICVLKHVRLST